MSSYPAPPFDAFSYLGMEALTVAVVLAAAWVFSAGQPRQFMRWLAAAVGAMALGGGLAAVGLLARADLRPPLLPILVVGLLLGLLVQGLRAPGRRAAEAGALAPMVALQSFRLPLECLMLHAAWVGVMPVEFSMAGYNLDVVTGASAVPLAWALRRAKRVPLALIWVWNLWGILCLGVIVALAVLTSPNVAFFGAAPGHVSLWVLQFPYVWLPTILVPVAVYGHLTLTLRLSGGATGHPVWNPTPDIASGSTTLATPDVPVQLRSGRTGPRDGPGNRPRSS